MTEKCSINFSFDELLLALPIMTKMFFFEVIAWCDKAGKLSKKLLEFAPFFHIPKILNQIWWMAAAGCLQQD